ncbi:MAG: sunset domain-containing protein [Nostoc sp.]
MTMNNQLKPRQLNMVVTLLTVFILSSCGQKPEESTSTTPQTPTAIAPASPASSPVSSPGSSPTSNPVSSPIPGGNTTSSSKKPASANKAAVLAAAQNLGVKPQNETTCPTDALVKGKITNKRGNIYHVPKTLDYEKVKPDICFKDPATAQQAGFRAPK